MAGSRGARCYLWRVRRVPDRTNWLEGLGQTHGVDAVCVMGAGGAGLAAAQALKVRDPPFVVYEAGSGIGGNWRYANDSGLCSTYASLTTNVSRPTPPGTPPAVTRPSGVT